MTAPAPIRLAVTPGEPAGIGPDLVVTLLRSAQCQQLRESFRQRFAGRDLELVVVADPDLLQQRAQALGFGVAPTPFAELPPCTDYRPGTLALQPVPLGVASTGGMGDPRNAGYVIETLEQAVAGTLAGIFAGIVTGPVNKALINAGGYPFTGHTEWLAARTGAPLPVMMLAAPGLRVALATTHLPLRAVADAITPELLRQVLRIAVGDLERRLGVAAPRVLVCGLNPHAGEAGNLGSEERDVIEPVIRELQREGLRITGPLPADTLFTPPHLANCDLVLAMYHDQGLAPLKQVGFGKSVNVTLGLPLVRTSVDHGTAFDLVGTGRADSGSLLAAIEYAAAMAMGQGGWP